MSGRQTVALFPLKSVLFPGALLQLKVFEARYLDLVSRCLRENEPFGVVCLATGGEVGREKVRFELQGVLAHLDDVDAEGPNLLRVRCHGGERFEIDGAPRQQPDGLWMAELDGTVVGGVTLRDLGHGLARLGHLALQPEARGSGAGRALVESVVEAARAAGYERVELLTFSALTEARELYRRTGFEMTSTERTVRWGREMEWERWELAL